MNQQEINSLIQKDISLSATVDINNLQPIDLLINAEKALAKARKTVDDTNEEVSDTLTDVETSLILSQLEELFGGDVSMASAASLLENLNPLDTISSGIAGLKNQFNDLVEKIKKNPTQFAPALCVDGKLSPELVKQFCDTKLQELKKLATPASSMTASAPGSTEDDYEDTRTFSTSADSASDSFVNMAKIAAQDSANESYMQAKLAQDAADQSTFSVEQNDALVADSAKQLADIKQQIAHIEHEQRRARHLQKTMGVLSHILTGLSVALACCTMNPALIAVTVALAVDQEVAAGTGSRTVVDQTTAGIASGLEKAGMSPQAAKIISDLVVIGAVAGAGGYASASSGVGMILAGQMLMSTNLSGACATAAIDGEHAQGTKEASNIEITATVLGAATSIGLAGVGGYRMMANAAPVEMSERMKTALTVATAAAVVGELSLQSTMSVMNGILATVDTAIFKGEKEVAYSFADFSLTQELIGQFSGAAAQLVDVSNSQIEDLANSLSTFISALGSEYKALT